jgi:enoyl-CoA hydratase/carnithine racemase
MRFCTEGSRFGLPAARLGLGYSLTSIRRLADVVGIAAAKDICLSARRYNAAEAREIGLVNEVLPDAALEGHVEEYAAKVAANAPLTIAAMKRIFVELVKDPGDRDLDACDRCRSLFRKRRLLGGAPGIHGETRAAIQGTVRLSVLGGT